MIWWTGCDGLNIFESEYSIDCMCCYLYRDHGVWLHAWIDRSSAMDLRLAETGSGPEQPGFSHNERLELANCGRLEKTINDAKFNQSF